MGISTLKDIHLFLKKYPDVNNSSSLLKNLRQIDPLTIESFAHHYIGVPLYEWTDATKNLFLNQLSNHLVRLDNSTSFKLSNLKVDEHELTVKGQTVFNTLKMTLKNAGRNLSREEIEIIIEKLAVEFSD